MNKQAEKIRIYNSQESYKKTSDILNELDLLKTDLTLKSEKIDKFSQYRDILWDRVLIDKVKNLIIKIDDADVIPEVPGQWNITFPAWSKKAVITCNKCGYDIEIPVEKVNEYGFCPRCGAIMRKRKNK